MKLSHVIPSALIASGLYLAPQIASAQDEAATKVEQICDENGNYLNPPRNRDIELETDICWMEANVVGQEAKSSKFNNTEEYTSLNDEPDKKLNDIIEDFNALMTASIKITKDNAISGREDLEMINEIYLKGCWQTDPKTEEI